jgi:hypothetical protein
MASSGLFLIADPGLFTYFIIYYPYLQMTIMALFFPGMIMLIVI